MAKTKKSFIAPLNENTVGQSAPYGIDFDEPSEFEHKLMRIKMKDMMMSEEERVSPDTFGSDAVFLEHFITERMEEDFSLIAKDFFIHEYPNIKDYEMVEYLDTSASVNWPSRMFERFVLNLMMNAVNAGSTYTNNLFLYLYKTYYRKEYQQLKRFNSLSAGELMALAKTEKGRTSPSDLARILTIARMSGIDISADCNFLYLFLNDFHNDYDDDTDWDWNFINSVSELIKDCRKEIDEIFDSDDEIYEMYFDLEKYLGNILRESGFTDDYVMLCNDEDYGIVDRLGRTLAILKKTYKGKEFTKEELIMYACIYQVVSALICNAESMEDRLREVIYGERGTDYFEHFPPLFKRSEIRKTSPFSGKETEKRHEKRPAKSEEETVPQYKEETLIAEIDTLYRKIHQQQTEIKAVRQEANDRRKLIDEVKQLKEQLESEHKELSALREHVYNMTEPDEVISIASYEEMKTFLIDMRVIIIGGHSNWRHKMKQEFPDWIYINPKASGTLEASIVDNADYVYFFTDTLSHGTYDRYMNVVKERKIDFGYIHGVNIENTVQKIYKDLHR